MQMDNLQAKRTRCEIWSRVMGYARPVSNFNDGKKSEFYSRTYFGWEKSMNGRFSEAYSNPKPAAV